jgi:UrcA family protein
MYFGFVIGRALPVTVTANWLATAWGQNAVFHWTSPIVATLEDVCLARLGEIFQLSAGFGGAFVSGAAMASTVALTAARHALLARSGWNAEEQGLFGALPIKRMQGEMIMNAMTTGSRLRNVMATVLLGGVVFGVAVLPADADISDVPQVTVKFGDLDISSPRGAAVLYGRIRGAAEKLCSPYDRDDLPSKMRLNACIDKAILGAVIRVNNGALAAVYIAKTGEKVHAPVATAPAN